MQWKQCWLLQALVLSGVPHPQTLALTWVASVPVQNSPRCVSDECEGDKFGWQMDSVPFSLAATSWQSRVLRSFSSCHELHEPTRLHLSLLIFSLVIWVALATHCWDICRWTPWSWWAFIILNMEMNSSATELSELWLFLPNPALGCFATFQFPHSNFFA